jgi:CrcB protein
MLTNFLMVAAGGAVGSVTRYAVGFYGMRWWQHAFPLGTFLVNVAGSLLIGLFAGWLAAHPEQDAHPTVRFLLMAGFCGGFTTFSAFSLETFNLLKTGQAMLAFAYIALSVLVCVGGSALGYWLVSGSR